MGQEQSADGTEHELDTFGKNSEEEVSALLNAYKIKEIIKIKKEYETKRNWSIQENEVHLEKKADKIINNKILVKKTNSSGIKFLRPKIWLKHEHPYYIL